MKIIGTKAADKAKTEPGLGDERPPATLLRVLRICHANSSSFENCQLGSDLATLAMHALDPERRGKIRFSSQRTLRLLDRLCAHTDPVWQYVEKN